MAYTLEKLHTVITRPSASKGAAAVWTQPGVSTISSYTSSHSSHRSCRAANSTRSSMSRSGVDRAGGVGRRVDEQHLGAVRDQGFKLADVGQEAVVGCEPVEDRPPAQQADHLVHVGETGCRQQHLVARLQQGQIHRVQGVHGTRSHHDLVRRHRDAVHAAQLVAEHLPQARQAAVGPVAGVAVASRLRRGLDHMGRGGEAGLAHLKADHVVASLGGRVEQDPYLRPAQPGGPAADSPHGPSDPTGPTDTADTTAPADTTGPASGSGVTGSGPRLWLPGRGAGRDRSSAAPSRRPARSAGGRRGARAAPGSAPIPTTS